MLSHTLAERTRWGHRRSVHKATLLLCLSAVLLCAGGCRSLRNGRQTRALSTARHLSLRGADELQQQKYNDAELLFRKALQHSEADERAHWGMAEVLWESQERERAIAHMATAAQISGESPDMLVRLGEMYFEKGMLDEALVQADAALNVQRKHCKAWALRGRVLQQQNRLDEALDAYHRALNQQEHFPEVQISIASIYQQTGRPQRALHTLQCMIDATPQETDYAEAWLLKGQALADLGEHQDARLCIKRASDCACEEDTELLVELAESQIAFGDLAEARYAIGRAMRYDPYNPNVQRVKAELDDSFKNYAASSTLVGYGKHATAPGEEIKK